jgi:broad specificity phosphatase PhoE
MVNIILIRHGETDWNTEQVFRGRIDVPLNQVGISQAEAVGFSLRDRDIDALYSSPLKRALETAQMLAKGRKLEIKSEEGFIDINFGLWQGIFHQKVKEDFKDLYTRWITEPHKVTFPEGESLAEVKVRAQKALNSIVKENPGRTVAIVSHRVVNKVLLCTVLNLNLSYFWNIRQDTCAVNSFEYKEGSYHLTLLNDTCHLKKVKGASKADF